MTANPDQAATSALRRLDAVQEVAVLTLDVAELRALDATSPVMGLVPVEPDDPAERHAALERLAARGLITGPGGEPGARPVDVLADLLAARAEPALVATVAVRRTGGATPQGPTDAGGSGATIAVLYGLATGDGEVVALLEEAVDGSGGHRFSLCTPKGQAARLFDAWVDLVAEGGPIGLCCHVFTPDPEAPGHTELLLDAGADGVPRVRSTGHAEGWEHHVVVGLDGAGWAEIFAQAVGGPPPGSA